MSTKEALRVALLAHKDTLAQELRCVEIMLMDFDAKLPAPTEQDVAVAKRVFAASVPSAKAKRASTAPVTPWPKDKAEAFKARVVNVALANAPLKAATPKVPDGDKGKARLAAVCGIPGQFVALTAENAMAAAGAPVSARDTTNALLSAWAIQGYLKRVKFGVYERGKRALTVTTKAHC